MTERIDTRDLLWQHDDDEVQALLNELEANCDEDPRNGIQMIPKDNWVEYVKEYIDDNCQPINEFTTTTWDGRVIDLSNEWPYRHVTIDYEAAAEELEHDYYEVTFRGQDYLCR